MTVFADESEPCGLRMALLTDLGRLERARDAFEGDFLRNDLPSLLDERFMVALRYASPAVAVRVEGLLSDLQANDGRPLDHGQRQTVSTLLGYLWRAAFNPTPFGAFAGSGWIGELHSPPAIGTTVRAELKFLPAPPASGRPCLWPFEAADEAGERAAREPARPRLEVELQVPAFEVFPPGVGDTVRRLGGLQLRGDSHPRYLDRLRRTLAPYIRMQDGHPLPAPALLEATRNAAAGAVPDIEWLAELAASGDDPQWQDSLGELTDELTDACLEGRPIDGLRLLDRRFGALSGHTRLGGTFRRRSLGDREEWVLTRLTGRSASLLPRIGGPAFDDATAARLTRWYGRWPSQADLCVPIMTEEDARPRLTRVAIDCTELGTASRPADGIVAWTALRLVPGADEWHLRDASDNLIEPVHLGVASRHLLPESARWLLGLPTRPGNALEALLKAWNRAIGRALGRRPLLRLPELRLGPALIASPLMGVFTAADRAAAPALGPTQTRRFIRSTCLERIGECGLARVVAAGRFGQPRTIDLATSWGVDQLFRLLGRHPMLFVEPLEPASFRMGRGLEFVTEFDCSFP